MKKIALSLLALTLCFTAFAQTYSTLPAGAKPYGNQNYFIPSTGLVVTGNVGYGFRVLGTKQYVDSLWNLTLKTTSNQIASGNKTFLDTIKAKGFIASDVVIGDTVGGIAYKSPWRQLGQKIAFKGVTHWHGEIDNITNGGGDFTFFKARPNNASLLAGDEVWYDEWRGKHTGASNSNYNWKTNDSSKIGDDVVKMMYHANGRATANRYISTKGANGSMFTVFYIDGVNNRIGFNKNIPTVPFDFDGEMAVNGPIKTTGASGLPTFNTGVSWGGIGSYSSGVSKIYNTAVDGTMLTSKTGSTNDFNIINGVGGSVFSVPTGTGNMDFYGTTLAPFTTNTTDLGTTTKRFKNAFLTGSVNAASFIRTGGLSTQFQKGDGSVDATSYLPLTGGTLSGDISNTSTGFFRIPIGTTAQRPSTPLEGMRRYNTTTLRDEFYANGSWQNHARLTGDTFTGSVTAPTFIGDLTGNSTTATALQNSRTFWGQNFNGTGNVTGAMTGVSDITATGIHRIGAYTSMSETMGGAGTLFGNGLRASTTTNNFVRKIAPDPANYILMRYDIGIQFHTNITGATNTEITDATNKRFSVQVDGKVKSFTIPTTPDEVVRFQDVPSQLKDFYTNAANVGTAETDLYSYTLPIARLISVGDKLSATFSGILSDVTASSQLKVYFAGQEIGNTGVLTMSVTGSFEINVQIIRTSSTTARATVNISTPGTSTVVYTNYIALTGLNLSGATNILKLTGLSGGAGAGSNDITATMGNVVFHPAAL